MGAGREEGAGQGRCPWAETPRPELDSLEKRGRGGAEGCEDEDGARWDGPRHTQGALRGAEPSPPDTADFQRLVHLWLIPGQGRRALAIWAPGRQLQGCAGRFGLPAGRLRKRGHPVGTTLCAYGSPSERHLQVTVS